MNKVIKKLSMLTLAVAVVIGAAAGFAAFEAHVINVTAHIENALAVDTYGIDFGTVFPQEYVERQFEVGLSASFLAEPRAKDVQYKIVQKDKPWTLNFGEPEDDVNTHNRSLLFVDPDQSKGETYDINSTVAGRLYLKTADNDVEDLYGPGEPGTGDDYTAPRMVIPMGGNFTVETHVFADPSDGYQGAGILAYGQDGDLTRLEVTNWGWNAVYMENQKNKMKVGKKFAGLPSNISNGVYLKLTKTGNELKGYYKLNAGDAWTEVVTGAAPVPVPNDMTNDFAGKTPKVGVSCVNNYEQGLAAYFDASFDYVIFNGDYLSLCRFLSKLPKDDDCNGDEGVESYYHPATLNDPAYCELPGLDMAHGRLDKKYQDVKDGWTVDLKVPPISGYVGQDWPDSCAPWVVEEDEMDYGCDLWIEVTGFSYYECADGIENDTDGWIDEHDPQCHEGCVMEGAYHPEWDEAGVACSDND